MHCIIPHAVNPYVLCYHTSEPWSESESVNFHFTSGVSVFFIVSFRWASNGPAGLDWSPYLFHIVSIHQSPFLSTPKYIVPVDGLGMIGRENIPPEHSYSPPCCSCPCWCPGRMRVRPVAFRRIPLGRGIGDLGLGRTFFVVFLDGFVVWRDIWDKMGWLVDASIWKWKRWWLKVEMERTVVEG